MCNKKQSIHSITISDVTVGNDTPANREEVIIYYDGSDSGEIATYLEAGTTIVCGIDLSGLKHLSPADRLLAVLAGVGEKKEYISKTGFYVKTIVNDVDHYRYLNPDEIIAWMRMIKVKSHK